MSFYLGIWNSPTAISDNEAARQYLALGDEKPVQSKFDSQVYAFYCRLTALYPEVEMVPEDELGACPWACSIDMPAATSSWKSRSKDPRRSSPRLCRSRKNINWYVSTRRPARFTCPRP